MVPVDGVAQPIARHPPLGGRHVEYAVVLDQWPCGYGFVQNSCSILVPVQ